LVIELLGISAGVVALIQGFLQIQDHIRVTTRKWNVDAGKLVGKEHGPNFTLIVSTTLQSKEIIPVSLKLQKGKWHGGRESPAAEQVHLQQVD
jgi:hypothetical protein